MRGRPLHRSNISVGAATAGLAVVLDNHRTRVSPDNSQSWLLSVTRTSDGGFQSAVGELTQLYTALSFVSLLRPNIFPIFGITIFFQNSIFNFIAVNAAASASVHLLPAVIEQLAQY